MITKVSFYGGLDEIGGNKILLEETGTRIFLDFGKSFAKRSKYYDSFSKPRLVNGIGDLLELRIIHTEKDVHDSCNFLVSQARSSLVFADYSYKGIDKFMTFFKIAQKTNRKLLIGVRAARYLKALKMADPNLAIPEIDGEVAELKQRLSHYENSNSPPSKNSLLYRELKKKRKEERMNSSEDASSIVPKKSGRKDGHVGVTQTFGK